MNLLKRYSSLAAIAVAASLLLYGCGESKIAQCNKLIDVAIKIKSISVSNDPAGLLQLASNIDALQGEMQELKLSDTKLKDFRDRFVSLYAEGSKAAKDVSQASAAKDRAAFDKASAEIKAAVAKEAPLVDEMNQYCAAK